MTRDAYTLRRLLPEDAAGVAACARAVYGDGYAFRDIYDEAAILRHNASGSWRSIVAVDEAGRVVGHLAVEPSIHGPVAETGMGMILAEHRRHRILERLRDAAIEEVRSLGFGGYFSEVGTENTAMQNLALRAAVHPCGITLGLWPRSLGDRQSGRQSFIRCFRYLQRPERVIAHALPRHEGMLARMYDELRVPLEFSRSDEPTREARIAVDPHFEWQITFITVLDVGARTGSQIEEAFRGVREGGMVSAYLELPLAQPGAAAACAHAERLGFFFAGVTPLGSREGDALRLQWLRSEGPISEPRIMHPFARELCDYVARAAAEAL